VNSPKTIERFLSEAGEVESVLEKYKAFFDADYLHQVRFEVESLKRTMSMDETEANTLKIGVVGAMKAGKSSFLNMLLFGGKGILPRASTPMTAALTRIVHSEKGNRATVHYYTEQDWQKIEEYDKRYCDGLMAAYGKYCKEIESENERIRRTNCMQGMGASPIPEKKPITMQNFEQTNYRKSKSEFEVGAHELVLGMENSTVGLREKLGSADPIEGDDLATFLSDYVGANGRYTPIVNYVELEIEHPDLEGVEIVDMPGLGDPIVSRCRVTKEFVKQCDVVLYLSTCNQFITDRDKGDLTRLLPSAGIEDGLVIASRFDGSITGYLNKCDLETAYHKEINRLDARYAQEIKTLPITLRRAFEAHPLLVTSSMADILMRKIATGEKLDGDEPKVYDSLKKMNNGRDLSQNELRDLSGIVAVKKELKKLQEKKQEIVGKRNEKCVVTAQTNIRSLISQLLETVQIATRTLEQQSVEGAREKRRAMESALDRAATSIASHFEEASLVAQKKIQDLTSELVTMRRNYGGLDVKESTRTRHERVSTGLLGLRKEMYTYTVKSFSVETAQIEDQVQLYAASCEKQVSHAFDFLVDTDTLRRSVTDIVLTALGEEDFEEEDVLTPLRSTFAKIKLPRVDLDPNAYVDEIRSQYPRGVATGTEIHAAKQTLSALLTSVQQDIAKQLKGCSESISGILTDQATSFVTTLRGRLGGELRRIESECADKEKNLRERRAFVDVLHALQDEKMK
jgi:hypothetical protein